MAVNAILLPDQLKTKFQSGHSSNSSYLRRRFGVLYIFHNNEMANHHRNNVK